MYLPGLIFLFVSAYLQNVTPGLLGQVIDTLRAETVNRGAVFRLCGLMLLTAAAVFVTRYIWRYFINGNARNLEAFLREQLFAHYQALGASFYNYQKTGDLMAYAINDINAVRMSLGPALAMAFHSISLAAIAMVSMATDVNGQMAAFVLAPAPVIVVVMLFMGRAVRRRFRRVQEAFASVSDRVQENISGLRVIKAYVQENAEVARFEELNQNSRKMNLRMVHVSASMSPAVDIFFGVSFTVALLYGSTLIRAGQISLGDFVAFNGYLLLIVHPVRSISRIINILSRGAASYKRYAALLIRRPDITDGPDDAPEGLNHADVRVRDLSFKYPINENYFKAADGGPPYALKNISFHLKPGHSLGILGRTGSGKTTLVNLLARLYSVPDGTVFLGGADANRFSLTRLRAPMGYVPQDNFLFSASVADNIRFFNPSLTREQVEQAAKDAAILGSIESFPAGFDTEVGERGMSLSGGQKQRVCIARALAAEPALLILDDSLSAVDTKTEAEILTNIQKQTARGGSMILIAHRVSALAACDEILVLELGEVAERGTHDELMAMNGIYAAVARDQMKDDEEETEGDA